MTEIGITHVNKDTEFRYKSVGKAMDLIETKVSSFYFRHCTYRSDSERQTEIFM